MQGIGRTSRVFREHKKGGGSRVTDTLQSANMAKMLPWGLNAARTVARALLPIALDKHVFSMSYSYNLAETEGFEPSIRLWSV
jgi:hypothetical protein